MPQLYVSADVWEGAAPMRWALYGMLPRDDMDAPVFRWPQCRLRLFPADASRASLPGGRSQKKHLGAERGP